VIGAGLLVTGCGGALEPAGPVAGRIADLWWVLFWLGAAGFTVVGVILLLVSTGRESPDFVTDRHLILFGGIIMSLVLTIPAVVMTVVVERDLHQGLRESTEIEIDLIGHQFWWDVVYRSGGDEIRTANEIHIPTGEPVKLIVTSADVIHSVWIPEIAGKIDLIPGHSNELILHADTDGVYEGRCAEFCGLSHALMKLIVVASPREEFDVWLEGQASPADVEIDAGVRQAFANSCAPCHTVRGLFEDEISETFLGDFGPDLTHLASRRMIGANLIPNTPEGLARWIVDPQGVKPGNRMPDVGLSPDDLNEIIDFLQELS